MSPSGPTDDTRVSVAPPAEATRPRRASYLALLASGVVTATAFAGIAVLASPTAPVAEKNVQQFQREPNGGAGGGLIAGNPTPEETTVKISGTAHGGDLAPSTTPTTTSTTEDEDAPGTPKPDRPADTSEDLPTTSTGGTTTTKPSKPTTTTTKTPPDDPPTTTTPDDPPSTGPTDPPCDEPCETEDPEPPGGGTSTASNTATPSGSSSSRR